MGKRTEVDWNYFAERTSHDFINYVKKEVEFDTVKNIVIDRNGNFFIIYIEGICEVYKFIFNHENGTYRHKEFSTLALEKLGIL